MTVASERQAVADITAPRLREVLCYDPGTGLFTWLIHMSDRVRAGDSAGRRRRDGWYPKIRIFGKLYFAHRLAVLYMTGEWPKGEVDHKNCDRGDNRWDNLRAADHIQNNRNKPWRGNASGVKGVSLHKVSGLWHARITIALREVSLGYFGDKNEAGRAYQSAARANFKEFMRAA